jgi:RimJ/RimL family protein N-acetyltransferase
MNAKTPRCSLELPASRLEYPIEPGLVPDCGSLVFRPPNPMDARDYAEAVNDSLPELKAFMPWAHFPQSEASQFRRLVGAQHDYWRGHELIFGIFAEPAHVLVGSIGLHPRLLNGSGLEIGYWSRSAHAGRGIMTTAVRCMVVYGFSYLGLTRIQCGHNAANLASARINDKCGFLVEGQLRNFEDLPTEAMRAAGYQGTTVTVLRGLVPEDVPGLPWYEDVRRELKVFDWQGERLG